MKQMRRSLGARVLRGTVISVGFVGSIFLGFFLADQLQNNWFIWISALPLAWLIYRYRRMPYLTYVSMPPKAQARWLKRRRLIYFSALGFWGFLFLYAMLLSGMTSDGALTALGASFAVLIMVLIITSLMARVPTDKDRLFEFDTDEDTL